jgi:GxxExxY protein
MISPQMNADERRSESEEYRYEALTEKIIGVFYEVYNELGAGFLEIVYHRAMVVALRQSGLTAESEVSVPVFFRGVQVGDFSADILVENAVLLELKAVRDFEAAHEAQLLNYLRATKIEIGLLMNFGPKPRFKRLAFANDRKCCGSAPKK